MSDDLQPVLLCALCRSGAGGECHTPGCALWMNRAPDVPVSTQQRVERVAGECPMGCGRTLFLGNGGHVTCSLLGCPSPCAVDDLLHCVVDPREQRPAVSPAAAQVLADARALNDDEEARHTGTGAQSGAEES